MSGRSCLQQAAEGSLTAIFLLAARRCRQAMAVAWPGTAWQDAYTQRIISIIDLRASKSVRISRRDQRERFPTAITFPHVLRAAVRTRSFATQSRRSHSISRSPRIFFWVCLTRPVDPKDSQLHQGCTRMDRRRPHQHQCSPTWEIWPAIELFLSALPCIALKTGVKNQDARCAPYGGVKERDAPLASPSHESQSPKARRSKEHSRKDRPAPRTCESVPVCSRVHQPRNERVAAFQRART